MQRKKSLYTIFIFFFTSKQGCVASGFYGESCSIPCPPNCQEGHCHITVGTCLGCIAGYSGNKCDKSKILFNVSNVSKANFFKITSLINKMKWNFLEQDAQKTHTGLSVHRSVESAETEANVITWQGLVLRAVTEGNTVTNVFPVR